MCTHAAGKSKVTAIIRVERLAALRFIFPYPTKAYIIIIVISGQGAAPSPAAQAVARFWEAIFSFVTFDSSTLICFKTKAAQASFIEWKSECLRLKGPANAEKKKVCKGDLF